MLNVKEDTEEKKAMKWLRVYDKCRSFIATNARATVDCGSCGVNCVIYLDQAVGTKNGPGKKQSNDLDCYLEDGYI